MDHLDQPYLQCQILELWHLPQSMNIDYLHETLNEFSHIFTFVSLNELAKTSYPWPGSSLWPASTPVSSLSSWSSSSP